MTLKYFVLLLLILLSCLIGANADNSEANFQILILNSEGESYPTNNIVIRAFKAEILRLDNHIEFLYENLNTHLLAETREEYYPSLAQSLKIKYKHHPPSLILALEFGAVKFLEIYGDSIFKDAPVLTIMKSGAYNAAAKKNWFHFTWSIDFKTMFSVIEDLQPKTKKIYAIIGNAPFEKDEKEHYKSQLKNYPGKAEVVFTNDISYNEMLNIAKNAEENSVIFYFHFFVGNAGDNYVPINVLKEIDKVAKVPVYTDMRHFMFGNVLGGYVANMDTLGINAARKCSEILKNKENSTNKTEKIALGEYVFNWRALKKFKIDSDTLPTGSKVIFREYTAWQLYWPYILAGLVLILLQTSLIILLLQNRKKRHLAEIKLEEVNRNLEQTVELQVAEIKMQNKKLSETNEQIVSLQKFKEEMTNTIVHDLKAPLYGIINPSVQLSPENKLKQVKYAALKLLNMVLNILDVYRYESTTMMLDKETCHLADIADTAIEYVRYLTERKNIKIENNIGSRTGIFADKEILTRVFINLFSNAIKFTPNNGNISISDEEATPSPGFVKIKVADNGIGIPTDKRQVVFDKFQQIDPKSQGSGHSSGLGLTFCRMAIEAHGGAIWIDEQTEVGTTVWFTLPGFSISDETTNKIKPKETEIMLSHTEKVSLKDVIPLLEKYEVSEITSLRKILRKIENEKRGNENWLKALKNAVDFCNEELYKELTDKAKEV